MTSYELKIPYSWVEKSASFSGLAGKMQDAIKITEDTAAALCETKAGSPTLGLKAKFMRVEEISIAEREDKSFTFRLVAIYNIAANPSAAIGALGK